MKRFPLCNIKSRWKGKKKENSRPYSLLWVRASVCEKASLQSSMRGRKACMCMCVLQKESDRETQRQMGLMQAWITRRSEWGLMCRISPFSVSHLRDGVCLTQEWLINLSSPHLEWRRHFCLYPHTHRHAHTHTRCSDTLHGGSSVFDTSVAMLHHHHTPLPPFTQTHTDRYEWRGKKRIVIDLTEVI